jgi:predicted MPP superfamily phosphohydrolase
MPASPILIAQISDLHITAPGTLAYGRVDTAAALRQTIATLNRLTRRPELIVITGDIADSGLAEQYAHARALLGALEIPYVPIPGNHDRRTPFSAAFAADAPEGAGKYGHGFSVVAQEVKMLAAQTAKATEEIGDHVVGIQAATGDSVATIKEIGSTIGRIAEFATAISGAVEEQNSVAQEIAENAEQAAKGTSLVANNIGEVTKATVEASSVSHQVLASAKSLAARSVELTGEVDAFLASIRVARVSA